MKRTCPNCGRPNYDGKCFGCGYPDIEPIPVVDMYGKVVSGETIPEVDTETEIVEKTTEVVVEETVIKTAEDVVENSVESVENEETEVEEDSDEVNG